MPVKAADLLMYPTNTFPPPDRHQDFACIALFATIRAKKFVELPVLAALEPSVVDDNVAPVVVTATSCNSCI